MIMGYAIILKGEGPDGKVLQSLYADEELDGLYVPFETIEQAEQAVESDFAFLREQPDNEFLTKGMVATIVEVSNVVKEIVYADTK